MPGSAERESCYMGSVRVNLPGSVERVNLGQALLLCRCIATVLRVMGSVPISVRAAKAERQHTVHSWVA